MEGSQIENDDTHDDAELDAMTDDDWEAERLAQEEAGVEEATVEEMQEDANAALGNFRETHSEAQQQFIADAFIETGEIPTGETFGITEVQAEAVERGYIATMERDVFSLYGITHEQWMEHVDPDELADFRRDAISGNWASFHQHAAQAAAMRLELGLPMSGGRNRNPTG